MLVILGDLRLSDGSLGVEKVSGTFFDSLSEGLFEKPVCHWLCQCELPLDPDSHSHRQSQWHTFAPEKSAFQARPQTGRPESLDVLLLGDVLDIIGSTVWLTTEARPWDDPHSPAVYEAISRIVAGILQHNAAALAGLRRLASEGAFFGRERVPVRIHYMVGDRDWPLHLLGPRYAALRSRVVQQMGLANLPDLPFPHEPGESAVLLDLFHRHHMLARHGDIYDPLHFDEHRDAASLGDALAIELLARFQIEVRQSLAEQLPADTAAGLAELHSVRPLLAVPARVERVLDQSCDDSAARNTVKRVWNQLVDQLLQLNFVRTCKTWNPVNLIDGLSRVLSIDRGTGSGSRRAITEWFSGARSGKLHEPHFNRGRHWSRRICSTTLSEFVPGNG